REWDDLEPRAGVRIPCLVGAGRRRDDRDEDTGDQQEPPAQAVAPGAGKEPGQLAGRPNRPRGRTIRTAVMMMNTKASAYGLVAGITRPNEITMPTMSAPIPEPTMLPSPPITLIAKASTRTSVSMLELIAWLGAP